MPNETVTRVGFDRIIPRWRMYEEIGHSQNISEIIAKELRERKIEVFPMAMDMSEFLAWRREHEDMLPKVDRTKMVPAILPILDDILTEKLLEYYLTVKLVPLQPGMRIADLGSSVSPFLRKMVDEYSVQGWAVDPSLTNSKESIPRITFLPCKVSQAIERLPRLDLICLHCSFEMFEPSEMEAVMRLAREKLVSGGTMLILPLYLSQIRRVYADSEIVAPRIDREVNEKRQECVGVHDFRKVAWTEILSPEGLSERLVKPWPDLDFTALMITNAAEAGVACFVRFVGLWRKPRPVPKTRPEHLPVKPPANYQIETFAGCNLRCPLCHAGRGEIRRRSRCLDLDAFRHIFWKIKDHAKRITLHIWGEPTLNQDLIAILRLIHGHLPDCVTNISTNALGLTRGYAERLLDTGLHQLIVSIDGWDEASYAKYRRGGRFQDVVDFVRYCAEHKDKRGTRTLIIAQCLQLTHTAEAFEKFKAVFDQPGITCAFKPLYTANYGQDADKFVSDGVAVQQMRIENCQSAEGFLTIFADGDVVPCCLYHEPDPRQHLGNILQSSIETIMNLPDRRRLIEMIRSGKAPGSVCATACGGSLASGRNVEA